MPSCANQPFNTHDARATAIALPSGATTTWSPFPEGSNLVPENTVPSQALLAGGRLLPFVAFAVRPQSTGQGAMAAYVMLTGHVSGPPARRYHLVVEPPGGNAGMGSGALAAVLSPNGRVTFVLGAHRYGGRWHEMIGAYATANGRLLTVLARTSARSVDGNGFMMPDPSGGHLLVLGFGADNTAVLNIATHRLSTVPVRYTYPPLGAAW